MEEEASRQNNLREEHLAAKLQANSDVTDSKNELRRKIAELDELKHQHFVVQSEHINRLNQEKDTLKRSFDDSLERLKDAHQRDVNDLKNEIDRLRS